MSTNRSKAISAYLLKLGKAYRRGDATEHTHRETLTELIRRMEKGVHCVNEPKGTKAGHPDIKVTLGETPLGYIETKDIGLNLAEIAESSQLRRYRKNIPNLILTDYLEFRWYRNGDMVDKARLGAFMANGTLRRIEGAGEALATMLDNFYQADVKMVASPEELAQRMAHLAQWVRRVIVAAFEAETAGSELHSQLKAFREVLLPDLDEEKFADMYAQTICYGLFAGKCSPDAPADYARDNAASYLPKTNPFLRKLFASIMVSGLNEKVADAIDAITFLLNHADINGILKDFGKRTRKEDPVVHFYETFLAEYDPKLRKSRGVYYTPEPVVSYIVRSVDWLLKEKFGKKDGLADPSVIVLDPACGTGTFLYAVIQLIHERVKRRGQYVSWSEYVQDSLLPRIFGFELLMAPYAVAHLKLGLLLQDTGYNFRSDERLGVFLTNTLEDAAKKSDILFAKYISDESNAAAAIKRDKPVMVVLGNPPYSGHSANKGDWIRNLVRDYYFVDGKPLGERNPKWLQDDYVKFIRWSQWRLERTGAGIHAYISNNGYLDNPTFRGMRQQLMRTFDEIHVLDLHGSSKKKEACSDGSKDENVFDIQQGVAIGIFSRDPSLRRNEATAAVSSEEIATATAQPRNDSPCTVHHADLHGLREAKYRVLGAEALEHTEWSRLLPTQPRYRFTPEDAGLRSEFDEGWPVNRAFLVGSVGIVTARDNLVIGWTEDEIWSRIQDFAALPAEEARSKYALGRDVRDWKVSLAQQDITDSGPSGSRLAQMLYRPFDVRYTYFTGKTRGFHCMPRPEVSGHVTAGPNLVLAAPKRVELGNTWQHVLVTRHLLEHVAVSLKTIDYQFPLYLYPSAGKKDLFDSGEPSNAPGGRRPNLSPDFIKEFSAKLGLSFVQDGKGDLKKTFGPENVFDYIYAVFHSPTYRKRYAEFLKIDFPRVPLTSSKPLFRKLCRLGAELVALHLMESPKMDRLVTKYPKSGNNAVTKVSYSDEIRRVLINDDQYFSGIRPEEWEFHIGGYQVLAKWLKDRKKAKRKLSSDDIRHYQRIVVAIRETIKLMSAIDKAIPKWPIE